MMLPRGPSTHREDVYKRQAKYTARTRMVLLTHPNTPTTTTYNRASLQALADFVQEHDLILVVDQAFEDYTFGACLLYTSRCV